MKPTHTKVRPKETVNGTASPALEKPLRQRIAVRAYDLFLRRGGEHGHADEDWLEAERQINTEMQRD